METSAAQQLGGTSRASSCTVPFDTIVLYHVFYSGFVIESCSGNPEPLTGTVIVVLGKAFVHFESIENTVNKQGVSEH